MKRLEFLQDSICYIGDDLIQDAKTEKIKRRLSWTSIAAVIVCISLFIAAIPISIIIANNASSNILENGNESNSGSLTQPNGENQIIWVDNRKYKEGIEAYGEELAYEWKWEYLDIYEKYWLIDLAPENETYYYVTHPITDDLIGEYIGEMTAYGYDDVGGTGRHEINCVVYSIKGAPDNDAVAVKLDGTDKFVTYSIFRYKFDQPQTFGEMIALKKLSENVSFLNYYYDHDNDVWTVAKEYDLSIEQSNHIWNIFTEKCLDAEAVKYENYHGSGQKISLVVSSTVLPMNGFAIEVYAEGYIKTNIFRYGSCFFIGKSAANEIIEYVLTDPKESPKEPQKWVAGTITEIGDDYFKINDAPMMENEEEGIEFTVSTADIKILRYFKSGVLKVGDTAIVKYDGNIYADEPTVINGAYSISECHIYGGDAYIPE